MPLSNVRVVDLCQVRSGPTCIRQLSEFGAQVIKVEQPGESDDRERHGYDFQNLQPNKRSLTLDLKSEAGKSVFRRLVERADVVAENFRPGVKHRLGVDYEALSAINPRVILVSISGFGQTGPYSDRAGLDQIAQGLSGFMTVNGFEGQGPLRAGLPLADLTAGFMAAYGVVMALYERERSGKGQWVHTSLLQAMIRLMDLQAVRYLIGGEVPGQAGNYHPVGVPTGVFKCRDGALNVQAASDALYGRFARAIGAPELLTDPRFVNSKARRAHREELTEELERRMVHRDMAEWQEILNEHGVPAGPIHNVEQAFADPQVRTLPVVRPVEHPKLGTVNLLGHALNMERTPPSMRSAAPERGEHTDEILRELEYTEAEIGKLRAQGVV